MERQVSRIFSLPWHPLAFCIYPIIALFAANITQADATVVFRPLLISLLSSCVLVLLLRLFLSDWHRAAFLTSVLTFLFFSYGHVYGYVKTINLFGIVLGRHRLMLSVWMALVVLAAVFSARRMLTFNAIRLH